MKPDPYQVFKRFYDSLKPHQQRKLYAMVNRPFSSDHLKRFHQPLVLVSQIQRSGGSLITRLFDSHPQIATHPTELFCLKNRWPNKKEIMGKQIFNLRENHNFLRSVFYGINKGESKKPGGILFEFNFDKFEAILENSQVEGIRSGLDSYFTSFFNSWLNMKADFDSLKYVAGFAPRTVRNIPKANRENSFFAAYPNGYLISILRHPKNWYSSAQKHSSSYADPDAAFRIYTEHADAALKLKKEFSDNVILISFDNLIGKTEMVMRMICNRIDIEYHETMLTPTFNSVQTLSNSSHNRTYQIDTSVLSRTPSVEVDHLESFKVAMDSYSSSDPYFDEI